MKALTPRQQEIISEYLRAGSAAYAAARLGLSLARVREVVSSPTARKAIEAANDAALGAVKAAAEDVVQGIAGIAFDDNAANNERLKALEMLGKIHGLFTEKHQHTLTQIVVADPYAAPAEGEVKP